MAKKKKPAAKKKNSKEATRVEKRTPSGKPSRKERSIAGGNKDQFPAPSSADDLFDDEFPPDYGGEQ